MTGDKFQALLRRHANVGIHAHPVGHHHADNVATSDCDISKLLMRDRVVWQAMGRFRTILDTQVIMDYLAVIVNSDTTRLSQLRNAYYKVCGSMIRAS